jgi:LysM repeat protein
LSISLVEFVPEPTPTATIELFAQPEHPAVTSTIAPTEAPTVVFEAPIVSATPTATETPTTAPQTSCPPPAGWTNQVTVQAGDTLDSIAIRYHTSKDVLRSANCLPGDTLTDGMKLYVPPAPTSTVVAGCIPGAAGWTKSYIVQPGDTLYRIGYNHYTTLDMMRKVNCRVGDTIYVGELLWVPNVTPRTPLPTPFPTGTFIAYPNP